MRNKSLSPISNSVLSVAAAGPTEGADKATGGGPAAGTRFDPQDPEVPEKKPRRRFTSAYKLRILEEADQFTAQNTKVSDLHFSLMAGRFKLQVHHAKFESTKPSQIDLLNVEICPRYFPRRLSK